MLACLLNRAGMRARLTSVLDAAFGAGQWDPGVPARFFAHLGEMVALSGIVYRCGRDAPAVQQRLRVSPGSLTPFEAALAAGHGALLVCPHLIGHEIMAGGAAAIYPITVIARRAPDPAYEALKARWYQRLGLDVAHRPEVGGELAGMGDVTAALRVLRKNGILAITPDLIQPADTGIPVRFLDRPAHLPAGAFFLAVRTGAAFVPCFFTREETGAGSVYQLWAEPPLRAPDGLDRDAAVAALAQLWVDRFEEFLREEPSMWQFWLDKRWAAWLREVPRSPTSP
jgi:lauroyl/myristoyl acyltransferase